MRDEDGDGAEVFVVVETLREVDDEGAPPRLREGHLLREPRQCLQVGLNSECKTSEDLERKRGGETREMVKEEVSFVLIVFREGLEGRNERSRSG